ncbi:hypothetical protein ACX93W_00185 [Paenibacillus sp. CAU 1782]
MKPNNQMTFRFEHKDQRSAKQSSPGSHAEGQKEGMSSGSKVVPLYGLSTANSIEEAHPWDSPYQDDISALEQLIRGTATSVSGRDAANEKNVGQKSRVSDTESKMEPPIAIVGQSRSGKWGREGDEERSADFGAELFGGGLEEKPEARRKEATPPEVYKGEDSSFSTLRRTATPSWLKVVFSVAGALLTGALFGYLLLALFIGPHLLPGVDKEPGAVPANAAVDPGGSESPGGTGGGNNGAATDNGVAGGVGSPGTEAQPAGGNSGETAAGTPMVSLGDVSASYTFLQFGVFSQVEGRDAALAELKGKQLPAVSYNSGKDLRVFAGIANGNAMAESLVKRLPDLLLYKKEMELVAPDHMPFAGKEEDAGLFFARSNELLAMWCSLTEAQLEQSSLSPLGSSAAAAWKEKLELWQQSASAMKEGLTSGDGINYFNGMSEGIQQASDALSQYDKKPEEAALRKLQEGMLKTVLSQKEWFESMSAL